MIDVNLLCGDILQKNIKNIPLLKPVELMELLIQTSSQPEDIVLDPCMGSGSVGIAAKRCRRKFIGVEFDKIYFNITEDRIENCC
jgi:site-specific DNA-methyltransferase (adenine-specific)